MTTFLRRTGGSPVLTSPNYADLYGLFPDPDGPPPAVPVSGPDVPEPYRGLLVHSHHMTVTVERFYGRPVDVRVLATRRGGNDYARKILLNLSGSDRVVQFGVVQLALDLLSPVVRDQILEEKTPLGRVLIQNNVFRRVQPTGYLRVTPNPAMCGWFGLPEPAETYGRLGVIFCDGKPAIEVLEVMAPVPEPLLHG